MPPRNRKFTGSRYCRIMIQSDASENNGNVIIGKSAVAQSGIGSVIHQHDIITTVAPAHAAEELRPESFKPKAVRRKRSGPRNKPTICRRSRRQNQLLFSRCRPDSPFMLLAEAFGASPTQGS